MLGVYICVELFNRIFPIKTITFAIDIVINTSSATIPILMWNKQELFKKGDNLILSSFGAGFAWGSLWIKWSI